MTPAFTSTTVETLVAERCACCARVLKDAQSVERGIGPDCFQKYYDKCSGNADFRRSVGLATDCAMLDRIAAMLNREDARGACNVILHAIACQWEHPDNMTRIELVRALGFDKLALRLEERLYGDRGLVTVTPANDNMLAVRVEDLTREQFAAFSAAMRAIPSRRWDTVTMTNRVAADDRLPLWRALRETLAGVRIVTSEGERYIPAPGALRARRAA